MQANKERKRKSNGPEPQIPSKVNTGVLQKKFGICFKIQSFFIIYELFMDSFIIETIYFSLIGSYSRRRRKRQRCKEIFYLKKIQFNLKVLVKKQLNIDYIDKNIDFILTVSCQRPNWSTRSMQKFTGKKIVYVISMCYIQSSLMTFEYNTC